MKKNPATALNECLSKIYRNEDLKTSMRILYSFLQEFFTLDFLNIVIYDADQHALKYRIHSTEDSIIPVQESISFSEDTKKMAHGIIRSKEKMLYVPNGMKHPLVRQFDSHVGISQPASIIMNGVEAGANQYAVLVIVKWEENQYSQENIRLFKGLLEPIGNTLRHIYYQLSISKLRQRLEIENLNVKKRMVLHPHDATPGLKDVISKINHVAKLDTPILVLGETGVGKELIANTIHSLSRRSEGPLISINCGAITESLLDSELFGHEKGAFTGAANSKKGFFEQAHEGTIFLDEVSELSNQAQVKLLRVLQNMSFQRVGGQKPISVDVRVIAAANRNIAQMVENKEFRKDLWYRLNTFPITIPPLRNRKADIPILAEYFAKRLTVEMHIPYRYRFTADAMDQLQSYDWPGNVRELENVIEQALILSRGEPLSFPHLGTIQAKNSEVSSGQEHFNPLPLNEMIRRHIMGVLNLTKGRIEGREGAAEILDMKPSTLRAKMKKLGIRIVKLPDTIISDDKALI